MLTATYSLVAMTIEQRTACHFLVMTRQAIASLWAGSQEVDLHRLEVALAGLTRFDRYCHERKVEKYVIPSVRGASHEIDAIVCDLDCLSCAGIELLGTAAEQLRVRLERRNNLWRDLCRVMQDYCNCLLQRLQREEEELLPLVHRMLSVEDWFALASKFLGDEQRRLFPTHWLTRSAVPAG